MGDVIKLTSVMRRVQSVLKTSLWLQRMEQSVMSGSFLRLRPSSEISMMRQKHAVQKPSYILSVFALPPPPHPPTPSTSIMTTSTEKRRSLCAAGRTVRGSRSLSKLSTCWWFTCAGTPGRSHTSARWVTDVPGAAQGLSDGPPGGLAISKHGQMHVWF